MSTVDTDSPVSVAGAVEFLSSRIVEQARKDSVPVTDAELRQLSFTEETASQEEIAEAQAFDETNDTDEFETKISGLLRNAFHQDVQHGLRATWEKHLAALRGHDVYVLVMVGQAGIPRPKPRGRLDAPRARPTTLIRRSPDLLAGLITFLGFMYFFVLRIGWHRGGPPILGNLAENLLPDERLRGIFLLVWLGSMIWLFVRVKDLRG